MIKNLEENVNLYGAEWILLEEIAKGTEKVFIEDILMKYKINWGELIEQAMSHKIFPMIADYFISNNLFEHIPPFLNQYFRICYDVNKEKVNKIKQKTIQICELLSKNGVEFVATKGVVLDNQLYGNKGYRFLSDADFIVKKEYKKKVMELLKECGFVVGTVDWKNNCIREMQREEYLRYITTPDKLPEFVCALDDEIIKYVSIGFVTTFTWDKCEYKVDIEKAFKENIEREIGIANYKIPTLSDEYHYIYIILHLYKHAWVEYLSKWNNDVNLAKFGDVYKFWVDNEEKLCKNLPKIMKEENIEKPILWTLEHTDNIFGTNIVEKLGYKNFLEKEYLNMAGDNKGNTKMWKGTMRDRLQSKDRKSLYI